MLATSYLVDAIGQRHPLANKADTRIVSLVPSITELLCDLGLASLIVGRTGFCIHPVQIVQAIPKIGGTKDVNIEKIRKMAPTHLIVNIDENEKPTVDALVEFIPHVIVTHPITPMDNLDLYRLLGHIFQVEKAATKLIREFEGASKALFEMNAFKSERVVYCIWQDTWMTVSQDTYISNMLRMIAWQTWTPKDAKSRYPVFHWNDQMAQEIDRILLSTEPYRFNESHVDALERQTGKPVQLVDGEMLSWYGSRAIEGLQYLATLVNT
ncbi:helical backbone metal receptor [Undibacterium sp. Dicai25W]|uniref:helical backbone metal receptor n=1 Tax=Undibacterium sp. Dicai25W TaxID=3413034 RepID=UPI003BF4586D